MDEVRGHGPQDNPQPGQIKAPSISPKQYLIIHTKEIRENYSGKVLNATPAPHQQCNYTKNYRKQELYNNIKGEREWDTRDF